VTQTIDQVLPVDRAHAARQVARWAMPVLFVALIAASSLSTTSFLTFDNLRSVLINTAITGIAAVGMTAVTLSGNVFSLGAGQSAMLASLLFMSVAASGAQPLLGVVLALVVLLVIGLAQSLVIAAGLNPVVTTLAVGTVIYGAVAALTGGAVVSAPAGVDWLAAAGFLTIPLPVWVFAVFTLVVWLFVERTVPGRRLVLVGANRHAALTSGVSVRTVTVWAFAIMSVGLTIAGVLSASQLGQVTTDNLSGLTVDAVAAVLVGGTAVTGGEGSAARSAGGALIIVVLQNVMLLHGLSTGARVLGEGALVILVIAALHLARRAVAR
jgi:ribose/xylose/arabinose/galactoside ABC-type transport system permease subunit